MKQLILFIALLTGATALGDQGSGKVMVLLGEVSAQGTRSNMGFLCNVTVNNQTDDTLTVTNLFVVPPGLALKISDTNGVELKRIYAAPIHLWKWDFASHSHHAYRLMYAIPSSSGGYGTPGIPLPASAKAVRVQIEGTMSGSNYSGGVTSNVVEVKLPASWP
jgi:hypothetical protein